MFEEMENVSFDLMQKKFGNYPPFFGSDTGALPLGTRTEIVFEDLAAQEVGVVTFTFFTKLLAFSGKTMRNFSTQ